MATIRRPTQFSKHFGIDEKAFDATGALDPVLNADTRLFIDPLLISRSMAPELRNGASKSIENHYGKLVKLLQVSKSAGDVPWREAERLMRYREVAATCLGYGAATVRGSGFGVKLSQKLLETAAEIVALGMSDPELFLMLPLIEEGVGPDLISDMTTTIIARNLADYTRRIVAPFGVPLHRHRLVDSDEDLPSNPAADSVPVLLVPRDILDRLPVATDWSDVAEAAAKNAALRKRVNKHLGDLLFREASKPDKPALRNRVVRSSEAAATLLEALKAVVPTPYDASRDPDASLALQRALRELSGMDFTDADLGGKPWETVLAITQRFKTLIERKGLWRLLWRDKQSPHHERNAQLLFLAVADAYCQANNLDLTPEAGTGSGPVDFKVSRGYHLRLLVEIKLSTNSKVIEGYSKQLQQYKDSEDALNAIFVVIDVGKMGKKDTALLKVKNAAVGRGEPVSDIQFVDGRRKKSATKL